MATGIKIFPSLEEAQAAGFTLYEKRPDGFLVRRDDGHSFALALVVTEPQTKSPSDTPPED
ncbi:MAG TPA: hypothetical protein VID24_10485 [Candidatus Eremiobacteraceae bacterium]|jgi:hypothetical protein